MDSHFFESKKWSPKLLYLSLEGAFLGLAKVNIKFTAFYQRWASQCLAPETHWRLTSPLTTQGSALTPRTNRLSECDLWLLASRPNTSLNRDGPNTTYTCLYRERQTSHTWYTRLYREGPPRNVHTSVQTDPPSHTLPISGSTRPLRPCPHRPYTSRCGGRQLRTFCSAGAGSGERANRLLGRTLVFASP